MIAALAGAFALAGCGAEDPPETPAACIAGPGAYLAALEAAPGAAELDDGTPIGDCLVEEQAPGALSSVGGSMVDAAGALNREARRNPAGEASVRLGYLVGSAEQAAESTGGIHTDLILRLNSSARYTPGGDDPLGADFERAYGEGYAAAQAAG
jgi:hypothetical protein